MSSDPTLIAGLVGAGGSILGALGGTLLGYKLSNSKPDIDIYIDNKIWVYYPSVGFSVYLPLTVVNEGGSSGTIKDFEVEFTSPTKQTWKLNFEDYAVDNTDQKGAGWGKGKDAHPLLVHAKSGNQHLLRFQNFSKLDSGKSVVELSSGEYQLVLKAKNRKGKIALSKKYIIQVDSRDKEKLDVLRNEAENLKTYRLEVTETT